MEIDPYKILELPKIYTIEQLRANYKKIALTHHPDKTNGSDYMFKVVTRCYKMLVEELKKRDGDKQFHELKSSFQKAQETEKKFKNTSLDIPIRNDDAMKNIAKKFNLENFNKVYEDNRISNATDTGYSDWIEKHQVRDAPNLGKNITKENFNQEFEKFSNETKDKKNKYIIRYKEPEPMMMAKKLNFIELGTDNIDDFSGENRSGKDLNYMDYRIAHSTTRLVDPTAVKTRKDYKTIENYEKERANIKKFSDKELQAIEKKKILEEQKQKQKEDYQKQMDQLAFQQFEKINKLLLSQSKY